MTWRQPASMTTALSFLHFVTMPTTILTLLLLLGLAVSPCMVHTPSQSSIPFGQRVPVRLVKVSDGDTIVVTSTDPSIKTKLRVRFRYIDCPESKQAFGPEATDFLIKLLAKSDKLSITFSELDYYKRALAVVYSGRVNVNRQLLANGYAWCYRNRCPQKYMDAQRSAQTQRLGLWTQANPMEPWEYRRKKKRHEL